MQNGEDALDLKSPIALTRSGEKKIIFFLCLLAAIHVFVFSTAFPFFNNVDEPMHFDLVVKYSHGHLPTGKDFISSDAATYLALFTSCAYFGMLDEFPGDKMPSPPWTQPAQKMQQDLLINKAAWQSQENYEVSQPPLYYAFAGVVWSIGHRLNMDAGRLLYSLRLLNIVFIIALVALGYFTARMVFPEKTLITIGVPALLALMPQTAFYSIGNDILSPLCFGATFAFLIKWWFSGKPTALLGAGAGLAFAATYLSKTTNLPLLAVAVAIVMLKICQDIRQEKSNITWPSFFSFFACAFLPIILWMAWCKSHFGDLSGSKLKVEHFNWTLKPFSDWWHHPIFTPIGMWTYLLGQLSTFWQGEFRWHNQPMALPGSNIVYAVLSLLLTAVTLFTLFRPSKAPLPQRQVLFGSFACFAAGLAFFGLLSIVYDFHNCPNPSREHPYFQAGRMILGMLIPFLLLVLYGLDCLLNRFGKNTKLLVLATIVLIMFAFEIATDWPVFSNPFNWYHLP